MQWDCSCKVAPPSLAGHTTPPIFPPLLVHRTCAPVTCNYACTHAAGPGLATIAAVLAVCLPVRIPPSLRFPPSLLFVLFLLLSGTCFLLLSDTKHVRAASNLLLACQAAGFIMYRVRAKRCDAAARQSHATISHGASSPNYLAHSVRMYPCQDPPCIPSLALCSQYGVKPDGMDYQRATANHHRWCAYASSTTQEAAGAECRCHVQVCNPSLQVQEGGQRLSCQVLCGAHCCRLSHRRGPG